MLILPMASAVLYSFMLRATQSLVSIVPGRKSPSFPSVPFLIIRPTFIGKTALPSLGTIWISRHWSLGFNLEHRLQFSPVHH